MHVTCHDNSPTLRCLAVLEIRCIYLLNHYPHLPCTTTTTALSSDTAPSPDAAQRVIAMAANPLLVVSDHLSEIQQALVELVNVPNLTTTQNHIVNNHSLMIANHNEITSQFNELKAQVDGILRE